ncbi:MAG: hypothetical protein ACLFOY_19280 [Desulfatibacillaceae bacterium]
MQRNEHPACPNCGEITFFVRHPDKGLIFLKFDLEGNPLPKKELSPDVLLDTSHIHCTACGWNGTVSELSR